MATPEENKSSAIPLAPLQYQMSNSESHSSHDDDPGTPSESIHTPKNYSQQAIWKLSIGLRFLLHENSPLNVNVTDLHSKYREFNPKPDVKCINKIKKLVQSLWISQPIDIEEMASLNRFWNEWYDYKADDDDDDSDEDFKIQIQQLSAQVSTAHHRYTAKDEDHMKRDYFNFITQYNQHSSSHIEDAYDGINIQETLHPDDLTLQKITQLKTKIHSRKGMANWLNKWKLQQGTTTYATCTKIFKPFRWKKEVSFKYPMNNWNWQHVVSFIEDNEYLKHFSSIFYEYHIDGEELCAMRFRHFEFLIEYALIENQNVFETDFDKFKNIRKHINKDWALSKEIAALMEYIHRGRIQSHVVSRYCLVYDILKREKQHNKTANTIYDTIRMLKPDCSFGPKQFWKMDAYFYCKIDNFLAVLMVDESIRKIYRKLFPKFVHDDEEIKVDVFASNTIKKRVTQTQLRVVQTGYRNWRMKSVDPITQESSFLSEDETEDILTKDTIHIDINPIKKKKRSDCLDSLADYACAKDNKWNQYTHAVPRVYFKTIAMFIFACLFGYLFVTLWYYNAAIIATDDAMKVTIEAIGEREVNYITYQLFQAQSLQHIGYGEISIQSDLMDVMGMNETDYIEKYMNDGSLDYLLVDWSSYPNTNHISSFFIYNNDTNRLVGSHKDSNDSLIISMFNTTCYSQWIYDENTRKRDINEAVGTPDCDYVPRSRPWYTELMDIGGVNNSVWTKPYWFYNDDVFGITLSTAVEYRDTVYIFLNELTVDSVSEFYDNDRLLLPEETVIMMVTPSLSVLASNVGDIDLYEVDDCHDISCHATNRMITKSMQFVRNNIDDIDRITTEASIGYKEWHVDEYWVNIFPFDALYMESLLFDKASHRGYIIITYDEIHWDNIEYAYIASWIICGISLCIGLLLIVYNIKFHRAAYFKQQSQYINVETKSTLCLQESPPQPPPPNGGDTKGNNGYTETLIDSEDPMATPQPMDPASDDCKNYESPRYDTIAMDLQQSNDVFEYDEVRTETISLKQGDNTKSNLSPNDAKSTRSVTTSEVSPSKLILNKLILEPRICQLTQQVLVIVLFVFMTVTFLILLVVWSTTASSSIDALIDDVMAPQEWQVVRDKVFQLIESAESGKQIITNRLRLNGLEISDIFNEAEFDEIFTNTMSSFVNQNNLYNQYFVYIGKPDGTFRGSRVLDTNSSELLISVRDATTNFTRYTLYTENDNVMRDVTHKKTYSINRIYDPRCRPWYLAAIKQRFGGTLHDAFPNNTWDEFSVDDITSLSRQTQECQSAVTDYLEIFGNDSDTSINQEYDSSQYLVWTTYAFVSLNAIGITASAVITQRDSNTLLGVVGIDYTLNGLSEMLNESIGGNVSDSNWFSWIFNADDTDPYMIASADGNVLTYSETVEGCLQFAMEQDMIPYSVYDHPELYIRIMSTEVLEHYGVDSDVWIVNDSLPFELNAPIDYPVSKGGKISYYPSDSGLDWFVMKLIDVQSISDITDDAQKTTAIVLMIILVLTLICFKEITLQFANGYNEDEDEDDEEEEEQDYLKDMFKMQQLIEGAANKVWAEQYGQNELMITDCAKEFMAERANQHITADNERNQVFITSVLQYTQESLLHQWFMRFMFSNYYAIPIQIVIICHILITFWEPANPSKLKQEGLSAELIFANTICILLEFIACITFNTLHRYAIFCLKREHLIPIYELYYGMKHEWTKKLQHCSCKSPWHLVLLGPHCTRYILRIVVWMVIFIDFLLRIICRIGIFSYRIPFLPLLFIVENRHVWDFFWEFVSAIRYASDVVVSYFAFIIVFAICAMSLFHQEGVTAVDVDSFDSITRAIITAFVYISTSENYDSVVSEAFSGNDTLHPIIIVNAIAVCLIFVVLGLFAFVPMIIHRFEESFNKTRIRKNEINKYRKSQALIAAFIMLDMDGNLDIDRCEFQQLVTHSILINKNKLFDIFNADGDDVIDINEFVSSLCKQEFRSKMFYFGEQSQNKWQSFMECNIFRRYRNRLMTFILLVLPVFGIALLRGLTDINTAVVDTLLVIFYIFNVCDITLRWLAFGHSRFFDLQRYPNPPYTTAAINKYNSKRNIPFLSNDEESSKVIRLSASDRKWVVRNLRDTRPISSLEKSVLSICHRLEAFAIIFSTAMVAVSVLFQFDDAGYQRYLLEFAILFRFFTLLRSNQKLLYVVFTVFPQFVSLITFLCLFIYSWARLGSTLFGDGDREIITEEVYREAATITTNFSTLAYSMLTLIQLMIGEGWHEIMYYNVMSTSLIFSTYFIFYIGWVTIIIANVFVGLFLADIDELKTKQDDDDTLAHFVKRSRKFKHYARNKLKELHYELMQIDDKRQQKLKQIETFKHLLQQNQQSLNRSIVDQSRRNATFALFD